MSILLDALRKSENNQKPVEPPNIHSNTVPMTEPESMKTGLLAIMLIVALLIIGWLVWRQYQPESEAYRPPVELPAGRQINAKPAVSDAARSEQKKAANNQAASSGNARPRTPVETYQPSAKEQAATQQERQAKAAAAAREKKATTNAPAPVAKLRKNYAVEPGTAAGKEPAGKPVAKSSGKIPATKPAGGADQNNSYQSPEPQPIGYWELPDNVRLSVPVIKFSVLVYAEQPANRFVLINGERYQEGDAVQPGLIVEEIRRKGVVFSFRLYRFFVER